MIDQKVKRFIIDSRVLIILVFVCVLVQLLNPFFLDGKNIKNILLYISIEGIIAIGMTLLIILGEIDLSVGATMSLGCTAAIYLQQSGIFVAVLCSLLAGTAVGALNGFLSVRFRLNSMPVTLATNFLVRGIVFVITKSQSVPGQNPAFHLVSDFTIFNIELVIYIFIGFIALASFLLKKTYYGRCVYAIGGNKSASAYSGIRVNRYRILTFMVSGLLAGVAGALTAARYNIASGLIGQQTALAVITAVLLGGVSLSGGEGTVLKAFFGFLLIGVLENAMNLLKFLPPLQPIIIGSLLIVTLAADARTLRALALRMR